MEFNALTAISPLDGRYRNKIEKLADYFSEYALFKYRVQVEVEYFIALSKSEINEVSALDDDQINALKDIYKSFSVEDAQRIKEIEKGINHDVKAVEYFVKEKLESLGLGANKEFVHFGLTSQDINNTSLPLSIKDFHEGTYMPVIKEIRDLIESLGNDLKQYPMLARTHGQPASPTTIGKEILVFVERLDRQLALLNAIPFSAKFGGATGNLNAHKVAYPSIDWPGFADGFLSIHLGLQRQSITTQIEHYDDLAARFDAYRRINTILVDLSRDLWTYISMDYFKQKVNAGEVGSSAMPHKVNPIDFENAEGNLGIANAVFDHLSNKLPVSRLQRDLTDSTVTRNFGVPTGHTMIAFASLKKGLGKLLINPDKLREDLESNWMVVAEAIQTVLRREAYDQPYEQLKALTRGKDSIGQADIHEFIDGLDVSAEIKEELKAITPWSYIGYAG